MKSFITFLALLVAVAASGQKILKTDSVYLTGKVGKFKDFKEKASSLKIVVNDLAFGTQQAYLAEINNDGTYRLSFLKTNTQDVMLLYNNQLELFLAEPGNHTQVNFDADDLAGMKFAGDGAKLNTAFKIYQNAKDNDSTLARQRNSSSRYDAFAKSEKDNGPEAHKKFLSERYAKESLFLTNYFNQHQVSPVLKKWATVDLKYEYLNNLMRYVWLHPLSNNVKRDSFKVADSYYDFIKPGDLNTFEGPISSNYGDYVKEFGNYIESKNFGKSYSVDTLVDLLLKEPAGLKRDIILSNTMYGVIDAGALDFVKPYLDKYKTAVQQPQFKANVIKAYEDRLYKLNNYTLPAAAQINDVPKTTRDSVFNKILAKYAGKVVYVDFWATWCGPCRGEMPNSKVLHKSLAGKDVVFLYLGVQCEEKTWKAAIAEMGIEGEHFLLNNNDFNAVSAKFQISGIPRYLLIDKQGRVFDPNAKRPGDNALKSDIEKLLAAK